MHSTAVLRVAKHDGAILGFHAIVDLAPGRAELKAMFIDPPWIEGG